MVKAKRIAQLEAALEEAQRAAHRQAAPFRGDPQKNVPWHPSGLGASADIRALADQSLSRSMSSLRSNSVPVRTAVVRSSRTRTRSSSSWKIFRRSAPRHTADHLEEGLKDAFTDRARLEKLLTSTHSEVARLKQAL